MNTANHPVRSDALELLPPHLAGEHVSAHQAACRLLDETFDLYFGTGPVTKPKMRRFADRLVAALADIKSWSAPYGLHPELRREFRWLVERASPTEEAGAIRAWLDAPSEGETAGGAK